MGAFARAFRRAHLPVRMSQGFNPRPRFSLPAPLSVGIEGLDEVLEIDLTEEMPADQLGRSLNAEMPKGVEILRAEPVEPPAKARVESVTYRVSGGLPAGAVERCLAADELRATRNDGREVDVRPYLKSLTRRGDGCEFDVLVTPAGSAKPAEIAAALCDGDVNLLRRLSLTRAAVNLSAS